MGGDGARPGSLSVHDCTHSRRDGVREAPKGYFAVGCLVIHASEEEHITDNVGVKVHETFL